METTSPQKRRRAEKKSASANGSEMEAAAALLEIHEKTFRISKQTMVENIASFVIEDLHSVSILNDSGFQKLMTSLHLHDILPDTESILANVDYLYGIEIAKLKDDLKLIGAISLSIEQWMNFCKDKYVTVRATYIDNEWAPRSNILATKRLCEPESTSILRILAETARSFEIEIKIVSIVCSGTVELEATTSTTPSTSRSNSFGTAIDCFVLKLQTCIEQCLDSVPEVQVILEKCKALVSCFLHNEQAFNFLKSYQKFLDAPRDSLVQYNRNEINSMFLMLERLAKQKLPINSVMADQDAVDANTAQNMTLSDKEWALVEEIVETLKPFQLAKLVIFPENEQEATVSLVKPLVDSLCKNFFTCKDQKATSISTKLKKTIKRSLLTTFKMSDTKTTEIKCTDYVDIATYLDPRYKNQDYLGARQKEVIRFDIKEKIFRNIDTADDVMLSPSSSAQMETDADDALPPKRKTAKALNLLFPTVSKRKAPSTSEWNLYLNVPEIDKNANIYEWWKQNERNYPELSKAAKSYLCTPAIVKVGSTSRNVQARRACLSPQYVDKLIFLNNKLH